LKGNVYEVTLAPLGVQRMPADEEELKAAVKAVLTALRGLHSNGFVHRDIRWENVLHTGTVSWSMMPGFQHVPMFSGGQDRRE
jgi:hypothetical protein